MSCGVPDRVRASQEVVLAPHSGVVPPIGAEEIEVGERPERRQLQENPGGHLFYRVPCDERAEVGVGFQPLDLAPAPAAVPVVEVREIVGEDGVPVLVGVAGHLLDELGLGGVLHVEREGQQETAQLLVDFCEVNKVSEVEPRVLAVALAADALWEEHAVRREPEVVVLLGQDARGLSLVAQVEGHAFGLQVPYLLLDGELRLPAVLFFGFFHGVGLS